MILQLAAERLALNLYESGFNVRATPTGAQSVLALRKVHLEECNARAALDEMLAAFGQNVTVNGTNAHAVWAAENSALNKY